MDEKLELIQEHQDGRSLNACLTALGVSKGTWHYRMRGGSRQADLEARDEALKPKVVKVVEAHPDYGYRRMKPDLEVEAGEAVICVIVPAALAALMQHSPMLTFSAEALALD